MVCWFGVTVFFHMLHSQRFNYEMQSQILERHNILFSNIFLAVCHTMQYSLHVQSRSFQCISFPDHEYEPHELSTLNLELENDSF